MDSYQNSDFFIDALLNENKITTQSGFFLKYLLSCDNERLQFILHRYRSKRIDKRQFIVAIYDILECEMEKVHSQIFESCTLDSAKQLSKAEREIKRLHASSFTYGEIDFKSFFRVLSKISRIDNSSERLCRRKFYDLGSGTSRAVLAAMIIGDFRSCIGIEILESLHNAAVAVQTFCYECFSKQLIPINGPYLEYSLNLGSILEFDWSDGDVVFANSTCFDESLMKAMSLQAEKLKPGTIMVTFTKPLSSPLFEILDKTMYQMSWGPATVFIHRRLNDDPTFLLEPYQLDAWKLSVEADNLGEIVDTQASLGDLIDLSELNPVSLQPGHHSLCRFKLRHSMSLRSSIKESQSLESLNLLIWAPCDWDVESYVNRPLLIFLHGSSSRGADANALKAFGLPKHLLSPTESPVAATNSSAARTLPALVCSPLCPKGVEWKDANMCKALDQLVDALCQQFSVDTQRIYLTGISMGGLGTWMMAARYPDKFAALVPICGGGSPVFAKLLARIPIWFAHSVDDNVIGVEETDRLVEAMKLEQCVDLKYTRYDVSDDPSAKDWMVGHNCWDKFYNDSEIWQWMLSHNKSKTSFLL